ncbi:hypothetical protein EMCRGX_G027086 [Ephydatia muelleri]
MSKMDCKGKPECKCAKECGNGCTAKGCSCTKAALSELKCTMCENCICGTNRCTCLMDCGGNCCPCTCEGCDGSPCKCGDRCTCPKGCCAKGTATSTHANTNCGRGASSNCAEDCGGNCCAFTSKSDGSSPKCGCDEGCKRNGESCS